MGSSNQSPGHGAKKETEMSADLEAVEQRMNQRIEVLRVDMKESLRRVNDRIDGVHAEVGKIPGQVLSALGPLLQRGRNGTPAQPAKQWHESVPWKLVIASMVFISVLLLIRLGLDPDNLREVVAILREESL